MAKKRDVGPWPHGHPTKPCDTCHGTGMSKYGREGAHTHRTAETSMASVRCGECAGRGRFIDDAGSVRCGHGLLTRDCALCRER